MYNLSISTILFLAVIILYLLYRIWVACIKATKNLSEEASKAYIWDKVDDWLSHEEEFVPNGALICDLIRTLAPYNQLQEEKVPWDNKPFGRFKLPCIHLGLISKNGTVDFPMIKADLSNCLEVDLNSGGYKVFCKVLIRENKSPRYTVSVVYATTKANQKKFNEVERIAAARAQQKAVEAVSPITDPNLEVELQQLDNHEDGTH